MKTDKIKSIIKTYLITDHKDEIDRYFRHIINYMNNEQLNSKLHTTKDFHINEMVELLFNGWDRKDFFKSLLTENAETDLFYNNEMHNFKDDLLNKSIDEKIRYLNTEYYNFFNYAEMTETTIQNTDAIKEFFNWDNKDYELYTSYDDYLFLKTLGFDSLKDDVDKYHKTSNEEEIKEDIFNILDNNLSIQDLLNILSYEYYISPSIEYKELVKDDNLIRIEIKELLNTELETINKHLQFRQTVLNASPIKTIQDVYIVKLIKEDIKKSDIKLNKIQEVLKLK